MPRSLVGFAAAAALAVLAYAIPIDAAGTSALHLTRPKAEMSSFDYANIPGNLEAEPSLFGLPDYQAEKIGRLKLPDSATNGAENTDGCNPYSETWAENTTDDTPKPLIALVKRGPCSFGQKALMAQNAGAIGLIVYNDRSIASTQALPKLAGGDLTSVLTIPGMITTLENGQKLLEIMNRNENNVYMSLVYSVIAPDDSVEYDFFTYPDEVHAQAFLPELGQIAKALEAKSTFTPHFRIMDGKANGCDVTPDVCKKGDVNLMPCGSQCTNCGRYCRLDPNGDLDTPPDGKDQVEESLRSKCVWMIGGHPDVMRPHIWHEYNAKRIELGCVYNKPTSSDQKKWKPSNFYKPTCNAEAARQIGIPDEKMDGCMGKFDLFTDAQNTVLEQELKWINDWQPLTSPYLFVNGFTYFGSFSCPSPATTSTCGPLSIICRGYLPGTAPGICGLVTNACPEGKLRDACGECGGSATDPAACETKRSGFPVGAVIGIIIACCVLIGGGVYMYMRRQNTRMKDDIDSLLKQYLPLEGTGVTSSNGKPPKDPNANLRLIGNLDTSDATDL